MIINRARAALLAVVLAATGWVAASGSNVSAGEHCLDPARPFDPACAVHGSAIHLLRQVCDYRWTAGCEVTRLPDPGYATAFDPSPGSPLAQRVGAVHEHSGYSDGDPYAIPADYFAAGRTGHNVSDDGTRDTGVVLDFMWSSEHSDNTQVPFTTAAACIDPSLIPAGISDLDLPRIVPPLQCVHFFENDDYWKWPATLDQARAATDERFTAIRGFEWTNDYFNHMNVYFSTNFRNVKIDGSYLSMARMWDWLRRPVDQGGGADGLLTFNHPGGDPALTPFDGGQPHNALLAQFPGGSNWNDLAYVDAAIDDRVVGIEVNGGDDVEWFVKALENGWHVGPVAAEDEHQREWSTSEDGKTLVYTGGRDPKDYYWAFSNRRTAAVRHELVGGAPGAKAEVPTIEYFADGAGLDDPAASPLGSRVTGAGIHTLHAEVTDLPVAVSAALVSSVGGQASPIPLGSSAGGSLSVSHEITAPATGEDWYFLVLCPADELACGSNRNLLAVTSPIWFR